MRFFKIIFILILSTALFSGCIRVDTKVKLNKDGSGTIEEKVLMSELVIQMMNQFMNSMPDSSGEKEQFSLFKEDDLKNKVSNYGKDVKYISGKEIKQNGWEGYQAVYSFEDINTLTMDANPNSKVDMDDGDSGAEDDYYTFKFKPGNVAELIINRPEKDDFDEGEDESNENDSNGDNQLNDNILKMMDGMRVKISLEPQGKIVNTNASYVDGSEVTLLDIDFGKLIKNKKKLNMLKENPPKNIKEMKELVKDIPGMKIEMQKPVSIKFN